MSMRIRRASVYTLVAPSRLVSGFAIRSGYDMGVAATADQIDFEFPPFLLSDPEFATVERGLIAVLETHEAYHWRQPLTEEEISDMECLGIAPVRTVEDRFREHRTRLKKIRAAVARGDRDLPKLAEHGLVMTIRTVKVEYAPVPEEYLPEFPFRAYVSADRLADCAGLPAAPRPAA
jgi:hypothetical protein